MGFNLEIICKLVPYKNTGVKSLSWDLVNRVNEVVSKVFTFPIKVDTIVPQSLDPFCDYSYSLIL